MASYVDFAGHFTFDLQGEYNSFCGDLEYVLDPSGAPVQTYLTYDGSTTLEFAPTETDPTGVHSHTLRVRLADFQAAYHDEPFTVEVIACDIAAFYADSVDTVAISPVRQSTVIGVTNFVIGTDPGMSFDFTFGDFDVAQSTGCEAAFVTKYMLLVSGTDMTQSLPAWISAFDPALP